jgi:hypothetical protein
MSFGLQKRENPFKRVKKISLQMDQYGCKNFYTDLKMGHIFVTIYY